MPSAVAWIDYSENQRRQMLDLIDKFREQDTVDELGIGTVRDALADLLFPGTSTIQTRAKYFLFIPWMYLALEERRIPANEIRLKARAEELKLVNALATSQDPEGTIGRRSRERIKRLPSTVYWSGLWQWGIRRFDASLDSYDRSIDRFYARERNGRRDDDGNPISGALVNWDTRIPAVPAEFPNKASFELNADEAGYLQNRIQLSVPSTLLAWLVTHGRRNGTSEFPWMHPQAEDFSPRIRTTLTHARHFSESMLGAALLYNLMLAEADGREALRDEYTERLSEWMAAPTPEGWDVQEFWRLVATNNPRISFTTQQFINNWLSFARSRDLRRTVIGSDDARQLIRHREHALKGTAARLFNREALRTWGGASGSAQLNYRWPDVQTITGDILKGLGTNHA